MLTKEERDKELLEILEKQPYIMELDEIRLMVCKDVFPPDLGYASKHLTKILLNYSPEIALDMGSGTGHLAFVLKRKGANEIWAVDNHEPAVKCMIKNEKLNPDLSIKVIQSDLFKKIPEKKFDLIVFNQPYYPATDKVIFGLDFDGGKEITQKFLTQAKDYLSQTGVIIMPFSDMAGEENNPKKISESLGYKVKILFESKDKTGNHYIYQITL